MCKILFSVNDKIGTDQTYIYDKNLLIIISMVKEHKQVEEELAEEILEEMEVITDGDTGLVYRQVANVYRLITDNVLNYWITSEFQEQEIRYSRSRRNAVADFIRTITHENSEYLDATTKGTVNLLNGVYYLNTTVVRFRENEDKTALDEYESHFRPHPVKNYYSFIQLPVEYNPEALCPVIDQFVADVFGSDKVDEVYDYIGYILLPHVLYQRAMIMIGSGKNGKTTFLDMLTHFLGMDNISQIPLQLLDDKFSLINLKNKLANIVSDIPSKKLLDSGNAKRVVTDETLSGNIKNVQGSFNFINRCKMLYSCNNLPLSEDMGSAFYRRWRLFVCDAQFDKNKDINILSKITSPSELSGLFNRALEGIERLKKNGGFPDTEQEVKEIWTMETNPVAEFIIHCCNRVKGSETKSKDIFNALNIYRSDNGKTVFDGRKIGYWLRQFGVVGIQRQDTEDVDKYGNPKWYTYYQGIQIKKKYKLNKQRGVNELWE